MAEHLVADSMVGHLGAGSMVEHPEAGSMVDHLGTAPTVEHPEADSMVDHLRTHSMAAHLRADSQATANRVCIPVRSAVSTMEAPPARTPSVDGRASAEADSMAAGGTGSSAAPALERPGKLYRWRKHSCAARTNGLQ
jgi:hypothetical protein